MLWKILLTGLVILAVWLVAFRRPAGGRARKPRRPALEVERCPACGTWRAQGLPCRCSAPPPA